MVILGLDPGIARTGYGVLHTDHARLYSRHGCLTTDPSLTTPGRLSKLANDLTALLLDVRPDAAAVEQVFFARNKTTAMLTAQAQGVLLCVLDQHGVPVTTLTPLEIKLRIAGHGYADKRQVQTAVAERLNLAARPQPDDAADALAAALCITT